jgi:histidine phosphotransferase ChpT
MVSNMDGQEMPPSEDSVLSPSGEADAMAALIASRICHDLVSPVGAISNGVELLGMGGCKMDGPEMQLVADSVAHASARLRFFRVAFGGAGEGQVLGRTETMLVLADIYSGTRLSLTWAIGGDQPRARTKLAFLLLQCLETALPRGGKVQISELDDLWQLEARADQIKADPALWALLDGRALPRTLRPAEVQFALAPRTAARIGRQITAEIGTDRILLTI